MKPSPCSRNAPVVEAGFCFEPENAPAGCAPDSGELGQAPETVQASVAQVPANGSARQGLLLPSAGTPSTQACPACGLECPAHAHLTVSQSTGLHYQLKSLQNVPYRSARLWSAWQGLDRCEFDFQNRAHGIWHARCTHAGHTRDKLGSFEAQLGWLPFDEVTQILNTSHGQLD